MSHDSAQICEGVKALVEEVESDKDAEISRLQEALEPFAKNLDHEMNLDLEDQDGAFVDVTMGDLRRAREALNRGKE